MDDLNRTGGKKRTVIRALEDGGALSAGMGVGAVIDVILKHLISSFLWACATLFQSLLKASRTFWSLFKDTLSRPNRDIRQANNGPHHANMLLFKNLPFYGLDEGESPDNTTQDIHYPLTVFAHEAGPSMPPRRDTPPFDRAPQEEEEDQFYDAEDTMEGSLELEDINMGCGRRDPFGDEVLRLTKAMDMKETYTLNPTPEGSGAGNPFYDTEGGTGPVGEENRVSQTANGGVETIACFGGTERGVDKDWEGSDDETGEAMLEAFDGPFYDGEDGTLGTGPGEEGGLPAIAFGCVKALGSLDPAGSSVRGQQSWENSCDLNPTRHEVKETELLPDDRDRVFWEVFEEERDVLQVTEEGAIVGGGYRAVESAEDAEANRGREEHEGHECNEEQDNFEDAVDRTGEDTGAGTDTLCDADNISKRIQQAIDFCLAKMEDEKLGLVQTKNEIAAPETALPTGSDDASVVARGYPQRVIPEHAPLGQAFASALQVPLTRQDIDYPTSSATGPPFCGTGEEARTEQDADPQLRILNDSLKEATKRTKKAQARFKRAEERHGRKCTLRTLEKLEKHRKGYEEARLMFEEAEQAVEEWEKWMSLRGSGHLCSFPHHVQTKDGLALNPFPGDLGTREKWFTPDMEALIDQVDAEYTEHGPAILDTISTIVDVPHDIAVFEPTTEHMIRILCEWMGLVNATQWYQATLFLLLSQGPPPTSRVAGQRKANVHWLSREPLTSLSSSISRSARLS